MPARTVHRDITIRGQVFPTVRAAAAHFGLSYQAIRWAMLRGKLDLVGTGTRPAVPMRVRIREMEFGSAAAAAAHFGLSVKTVQTAVWRGTQDRIGLPRPPSARARPVTLHGVRWPSRAAACRALGLSHGFLWHVEHGGGRAARERLLAAVMAWRAQGPTGRRLRAVPGDDHGAEERRGEA